MGMESNGCLFPINCTCSLVPKSSLQMGHGNLESFLRFDLVNAIDQALSLRGEGGRGSRPSVWAEKKSKQDTNRSTESP